jgi:AraC family transcriptional regulator of adaptative response / DNA-3-methyladenine glycosylase II
MSVRVSLGSRPPLDAGGLIAFLGVRAIAGVEEVQGGVYRRSLRLAGGHGLAEVRAGGDGLEAELWLEDPGDRDLARASLRRLLDLDADPVAIDGLLARDQMLAPLVRAAPGRRLPGCVDPVEIAVRAVLGQQVTVRAGVTLAGRLVSSLGDRLDSPRGGVTHVFPGASAIAGIDPQTLAMPASRKRALSAICSALASGELDLSPDADPIAAREAMIALPGIGPWTAEYVAMRALADGDAFLASDLGVRRALEGLGADGSLGAALARAEAWRPWRAYAQQHLWASLSGKAAA